MPTSFHTRGIDSGFVRMLLRRHIVAEFGNECLGHVRLTERRFRGFGHYGCKEVSWSGLPLCVLTLPQTWSALASADEELAWAFSRPSLYSFLVPPHIDTTAWTWTPEDLLEEVHRECKHWFSLPETARTNRTAILYACNAGTIETFRATGNVSQV